MKIYVLNTYKYFLTLKLIIIKFRKLKLMNKDVNILDKDYKN